MNEWRKSPAVALTLIVLFIVIQIVVPVTRLGEHDNAQRFGWQMFSALKGQPEFTVQTDDSSQPIDLTEVLARVRDDLFLEEEVPEFLCITVPDAVKVTWENREHRC